MEIKDIEKLIESLLEQHKHCPESHHTLAVVDNQLVMLHNDRSLTAPQRVFKLTDEQVKLGFLPQEWSIITRRALRTLKGIA